MIFHIVKNEYKNSAEIWFGSPSRAGHWLQITEAVLLQRADAQVI